MRAARGTSNVGPREWVLTLELGEATLNAATRRREIGGREGDNIEHPDSTLAYHVQSPTGPRVYTMLECCFNKTTYHHPKFCCKFMAENSYTSVTPPALNRVWVSSADWLKPALRDRVLVPSR